MADTYTITIPIINSAKFATNPATINSKIKLSVFVSEETKELKPVWVMSGTAYSGGVLIGYQNS
jgi:hypothetical protein